MRSLSNKEFIEKAIKLYGDKCSYEDSNYIKSNDDIIITCKKHGTFSTKPNYFLSGRGCKKCGVDRRSIKRKLDTKSFIEKCIDLNLCNKFSFEKVKYVSAKYPISITCKTHGDFTKTPTNFLHRPNCPKCSTSIRENINRISTLEFIKKCENVELNKNFTFNRVEYINNRTNVIITCKIHGDFSKNPYEFLSRKTCPKCHESIGEKIISEYFDNNEIFYIRQHTFVGCIGIKKKLPFDFYIPSLNICVEYDGRQHYDKSSKFYSSALLDNDEKRVHIAN